MKRVLAGLGGLALLTVLYLPADTKAAPAGNVMAKDNLCGVFNATGGFALGTDSIIMSNAGGVAIIKCSVKGLDNPGGQSMHFDYESTGVMCGTAAGPTTDWHETISASGNATLTCRMKR